MITKRLLIAQLILLGGLSLVFALPKVADSTPQGIALTLPSAVGGWLGEDQKITDQELLVLAKDTEFARKLYKNGRGDEIFASIVLSGQDLDNSIHRPERCLPAQGWSIADSRVVRIPIQSSQQSLAVTRLHNMRKIATRDGRTVPLYGLDYYWFVGAKDITPSHLRRTYIDIRDRLMYGYNQRWAYITVAGTVTEGFVRFGRSEQQVDEMIQQFIRDLFPQINGAQHPAVAAKS